jgi:hypothetical protein
MNPITDLEKKIKAHEDRLKDLHRQLETQKAMSPDKMLAEELHSLLCQWNHTDGCSWFYESKNKVADWSGHAHNQYLTKAQTLMLRCKKEGIEPETVVSMFKLVKGL